jgi:hypothetical protein
MSLDARPAPGGHPFSPRTVFVLLLVGMTTFVALGVLGAYAPALRARTQGGDNALSRSAVGYAGLVTLLRAQGIPVIISRARVPAPSGAPGIVVFTPPASASAEALAAALPRNRRTLVVLPKWFGLPDPNHPGWVQGHLAADGSALLAKQGVTGLDQRTGTSSLTLANVAPLFQPDDNLRTGPIEGLRTFKATGGETQLADDAGRPVLVKFGQNLYVLSDPDLLDNTGVASLDTARTASTLIDELRSGQGPVVWDVTLNGLGRARSLLGLALTPPFLGASLCGLATALLMGAHAAARFGPSRPQERAYGLGKAALLDNTAMLIRLARREPRMGRRYAALVRRALGRRVLALRPGELAAEADAGRIDAALDRLARPGETPFSELAWEADGARDEAGLMRAVRRLYQRRLEMLGERS